MHILSALSPNGIVAIVEFPGVLYRSSAEEKIRKYLVEENYVDAVIALPENLFFGVSIATCIIVLKKNEPLTQTLFINAGQFFIKVTNKNKLEESHTQEILSIYKKRENLRHICALVDNNTIAKNSYNLSPSSYIEAKDTREKTDIGALNSELKEIVRLQGILRNEIDMIVQTLEKGA
ncbi:type I restriction enzyme M protein [Helicobacter muridarum]|uniref:site-specific DNA-methyltransferase (adenine-specific) n=1 Tax=Helicobacter muridarum TaxID=216 RepID=A0A377PU30_9HELI|nr:type I restriction enzyme M protein [Helicobacter muridarum]